MLQSIRVLNLLSFGSSTSPLDLGPLNVLIGPNGSGKSNLIDALSLLVAAPGRAEDLASRVSEGGGVHQWMWKGREANRAATITTHIDGQAPGHGFRHSLQLKDYGFRLGVHGERIERLGPSNAQVVVYDFADGVATSRAADDTTLVPMSGVDPAASILAQRRDPERHREITFIADLFRRIRMYRDWTMGRNTPARQPQPADLRGDFLSEDCSNLALVLSALRRDPATKRTLVEHLRELYDGVDDFEVVVEGGRAQIFFQEGAASVPATRLSDGTLRYLCLLAILCHPSPPPLVCIEEPEIGLHPDIMPTIAKLLVAASTRTQLIVTTHSDILIDALTETPDSVVVCEKIAGATQLRRLDPAALAAWLKDYRLGTLWTQGKLGGNRW